MYVITNGTKVELNGIALRRRKLVLVEGTETDQCDNCGGDLFGEDLADVVDGGRALRCPKCGQEFEVQR